MATADEAMPRAKRLKLLREAKARKERGETNQDEAAVLEDAPEKPVENGSKELDVEKSTHDKNKTEDNPEEIADKLAQRPEEEDTNVDGNSDDETLNLAPKRANWDIERDIAPMLRKLERRTQHAIVEILREELAAQQLDEDSGTDEEDGDDDDEEEEEEEEEAAADEVDE